MAYVKYAGVRFRFKGRASCSRIRSYGRVRVSADERVDIGLEYDRD